MNSVVAVMPVLVGPLQVLLALLPAILAALGGMLLAMFKPSGFKKLVRFFWHQKLFTALLLATGAALWYGYPKRLWSSPRAAGEVSDEARASAWPMLRGGPERMGWSSGDDPTAPGANWAWTDHKTVFGSPTVAGGRVYFSTVTDLGPFTPQGRGAIVCCDAESGRELWRYDDEGQYRATFSAPVVAEERVVVGEGLHITADARVTCLDLSGRKVWEYRTMSHVEATPCIDNGRVYVSAGADGFYCFSLMPNENGSPRVLWHLQGEKYPDCESSPVTDGETVWFGLGEGGNALVAVDAATGEERWRAATPHPVFTGPTLAGGKLFIGVGNGNFIVSAEELRARRIEEMKEAGAPKAAIDAAYEELAPYGAVWCVDAETGQVDWQFRLKETVLDSIACRDGRLYFGSRDGTFYSLSTAGEELAHWDAGAIILASAAAGRSHVYVATNAGRLHCLKTDTLAPVWDMPLQGEGVMSSSPTLAGGRVYLGTDTAGLRCVGTTEAPEPPVWSRGEVSGAADDSPLPERGELAWTFDPKAVEDPSFLMPLGDSLYFTAKARSTSQHTREELEGTHLFRVRCLGPAADAPQLVWKVPATKSADYPIRGSGDFLVAASPSEQPSDLPSESDISARFSGGRPITWRCHRVSDGATVWEWSPHLPRQGNKAPGFTVDAERAYVWANQSTLACLELASGRVLWQREFAAPASEAGSPVVLDGILYANATTTLVAFDPPTGRILWERPLDSDGGLQEGPFVSGGALILRSGDRLAAFSPADGAERWHRDLAGSPPVMSAPSLTVGPNHLAVSTDGGTLLIRSSDGEVVTPEDFDSDGPARRLILDRQLLEFPKGRAHRRDLESGFRSEWLTAPELDALRGPPVAAGGRVYLPARGILCLRGAQP